MVEKFRGILANITQTELPILNATCQQMDEYASLQSGSMRDVIDKVKRKFGEQGATDWVKWKASGYERKP